MGPRPTTLEVILLGFPDQRDVIERALRDQPSFRELCEDYRRCADALERWRRLNGQGPTARSREYAELLEELSHEIEDCLAAAMPERSPAGGAAP